ncbi:MAG: hypothetical protein ACRD18_09205, partial [Terriglobia bacterium]
SVMLVGVTSFGSVWRRRFGSDPRDAERFRRAAYFNTTGVLANGVVVRHRKIVGHARFNGAGGFNPYYPYRAVGGVFECDEPSVWQGQNKVFFGRRLDHPGQPDYFLVVVRSCEFGRADVGARGWKSHGSLLISFSEWRDQQELMLLVPPDGWVRTRVGRVAPSGDPLRPCAARLRLCDGDGREIL